MDEFSFKEMKTWSQFKISSCCLCVRCKPRELGGRGSSRFSTPMVESFSADLLPAIKSCWAELHLKLFTLLWLNLGLRREYLTSLHSWIVARPLITCVWPVYLVDELVLVVLSKVIGESWIWNSIKHRRRSYSSKVYGAPLNDWANGGYVHGLFQVWWVGVGVSSDDDCGICVWHAKIMWYIINAASILSRVTRTWPRSVVNSSPAVDTLQLLGLCRLSFMSRICHFVYFVMPFTSCGCLGLPFPIVLCPLPPIPFLCSW